MLRNAKSFLNAQTGSSTLKTNRRFKKSMKSSDWCFEWKSDRNDSGQFSAGAMEHECLGQFENWKSARWADVQRSSEKPAGSD
jgi:hypothetical protein